MVFAFSTAETGTAEISIAIESNAKNSLNILIINILLS